MDRSGWWTHGIVVTSPIIIGSLGAAIGGWAQPCLLAVTMPMFGTLALGMGVTHLLAKPRWIGWGIAMLVVAGALFMTGYAAHTLSTIDGPDCIPHGWEAWPWLY